MSRPKIKIEKENVDLILEVLAIVGILFLIAYPLFHYNSLPDEIPSHFGPSGQPDDYQSKNFIWVFPVLGVFIYLLLTIVSRIPHTFNFTVKITEENATTQYQIAVRMISVLKTIILFTFAYISFTSIQIALGNKNELGYWFLPVLLFFVFAPIVYTLRKSSSNK